MKIGVSLFTYKRTDALKAVLEALESIKEIDTLYIFQDGVNVNDSESPEEAAKWHEVNRMIHQIDWCRTIICASKENKGCAVSIIKGINKVLEENDAVIVIEDDCVPHRDFYAFMKQSLERYADDKRVYCISGYAWPIEVEQPQGVDAYFCGRTSSWGWGTWKDRWDKYSRDYLLLEQAREDRELSARLGFWGNDLEAMLIGNLKGTIDAWDVFWSLLVINERGYCLNPYQSLIHYAGFDGEGRHCGGDADHIAARVELSQQRTTDFKLPDQVVILPEIEDAIVRSGLFKAVKDTDKADDKETVLLYGPGAFYQKHERYLFDNYKIVAFIDRVKRGYLHGKEIIRIGGIKRCDYDKIIVMLQDIGQCQEIVAILLKQGVEATKIVLGHDIIKSAPKS
jgi:GR25 family glycosyltransferase involved in LPS biosynthesis